LKTRYTATSLIIKALIATNPQLFPYASRYMKMNAKMQRNKVIKESLKD